ncbi:MAG: DUF523 domain-containing protein [Spirochaetales bacterium]|nr:DUF523 domain-containing protein [Spirochaetales bacterium]
MKLVSACLLGIKCNYANKAWFVDEINKEFSKGELFPVCAEVLGGLDTPRHPSEIQIGDGYDVIDGKARVLNEIGEDVTEQFLSGAYKVLEIANTLKIEEALFIERSPSCGCDRIFDGSFSFRYKKGDGVTCALLKRNGFKVKKILVDAEYEEEQMKLFRQKEEKNSNQ